MQWAGLDCGSRTHNPRIEHPDPSAITTRGATAAVLFSYTIYKSWYFDKGYKPETSFIILLVGANIFLVLFYK